MKRSTQLVAGMVLVAAVGLAALTLAVVRHEALGGLDGSWRDWVLAHRNGTLTQVMAAASNFGSSPSLIVIALAAAGWLVWHGRRNDSLIVVIGAASVLVVSPFLKLALERPRPAADEHLVSVDSWSYPSGHSLNSMVVLGLLTVLAVRSWEGGRRVLAAVVGALLVFLVGFSRVYLGVHWPSDVLAGWLLGVMWLTICFTSARVLSGNSESSGTVRRSS
jgi:membrane-associated phospholipid phosphatase